MTLHWAQEPQAFEPSQGSARVISIFNNYSSTKIDFIVLSCSYTSALLVDTSLVVWTDGVTTTSDFAKSVLANLSSATFCIVVADSFANSLNASLIKQTIGITVKIINYWMNSHHNSSSVKRTQKKLEFIQYLRQVARHKPPKQLCDSKQSCWDLHEVTGNWQLTEESPIRGGGQWHCLWWSFIVQTALVPQAVGEVQISIIQKSSREIIQNVSIKGFRSNQSSTHLCICY